MEYQTTQEILETMAVYERRRRDEYLEIQKQLDRALNPPPEPEIVVTEKMISAGMRVQLDAMPKLPKLELVYRAMRKLEPKPFTEDHPNMEERLRGSK